MILRKWNYETHEYEPFEVSDSLKAVTYSADMDELIDCPHCGRPLLYGESFPSLEIHTAAGFGYAVCQKCYSEEWVRRGKHE